MSQENSNGRAIFLSDRARPLANYPHARVAGGLIFVSGISSRRPDNTGKLESTGSVDSKSEKELPGGTLELDIRAQTKAVIENLETILKEAGASLKNIVDLTVFLVNMDDYTGFNEVYNTYFEAQTGPARTTVAVKQLPSVIVLAD
ncbi:9386_t:CDS:2 [Racocetra fulgida]|uniref:9386_t:CDS:1 n=1 Tax=Racocetra fulgida TaxID=60492 RepID=A0A9N9FRU8_9GLOM|nr:9386_t:CDS:2 [Racocetra fulgida]